MNNNLNRVKVLVPMKGHSERVPHKNLRMFNGKPLFSYVIENCLNASSVENVYVNTDSDKIAQAVNEIFPSVQIIHRPEVICGDFVSMNKIIEHDLSVLEGEHFLQTHSTNPLLSSATIDAGIKHYFNNIEKYDSVFSVTEIKTRLYSEEGKPINHNPAELIRTQDLPPLYEENSNFYIFSKTAFANAENKRIGVKPIMFPVNKLEALDIDNIEDFLIAEAIHPILQKR